LHQQSDSAAGRAVHLLIFVTVLREIMMLRVTHNSRHLRFCRQLWDLHPQMLWR
jgi:hypothetical protein